MSELQSWQEIRDRLEARRAAVNAEIAGYPAPIPGCDAQFNHLLEERSAIAAAMQRLETASAQDVGDGESAAVARFVASCSFLVSGEKII